MVEIWRGYRLHMWSDLGSVWGMHAFSGLAAALRGCIAGCPLQCVECWGPYRGRARTVNVVLGP